MSRLSVDAIDAELEKLIHRNSLVYEQECINLNPAGNVPNPRADRALAQAMGSHPSLGYPGAKYEMGLEAIERIEVIAGQLASEVFNARYVETRVPSGAI